MNLENEIKNNIKNENDQFNFFNNLLGKTINSAIDIGLRTILPDLIENQIIDIKNALLENGLKGGIESAIHSIKNFTKSATGIITGKFENMEQIEIAISNGGLVDTISDVLDFSINKIYEKGYINNTINSIIKNSKNTILNNICNNIKNEINNQNNLIQNIEKDIKKWNQAYNNKDIDSMNEIYNYIEENSSKIIPIENLINETRKIQNIHNYIKERGYNFEITELEKEVLEKISNIK